MIINYCLKNTYMQVRLKAASQKGKEKSTGPTLATKDRNQKEEGIWPWRLGKGDLKHSQLKKMKRQRNIVQMKEQARNTQDRINKEEIGKLPEKEYRIMIVKMIKNL